ncbi:MAG TPA: calcium-binding protein, partial [Magnetospirillum sp.]|nr:calcium-binding protein [Magnetospirillum sp.]
MSSNGSIPSFENGTVQFNSYYEKVSTATRMVGRLQNGKWEDVGGTGLTGANGIVTSYRGFSSDPTVGSPSPLFSISTRVPLGSLVPNNDFVWSVFFSGADTINGSALNDVLYGLGGNDLLAGKAGADTLYGGAGMDTLAGGDGNDILNGGDGLDTAAYVNFTGAVTVDLRLTGAQNTGNAGSDTFVSIENLVGGSGTDALRGNASNNLLVGNAGADTLVGYAGADTLVGGVGSDTMHGGIGADRFRYVTRQDGGDTITDFHAGEGDKLVFLTTNFGSLATGQL